jgi:glucan 1,3-beta-glucosidase
LARLTCALLVTALLAAGCGSSTATKVKQRPTPRPLPAQASPDPTPSPDPSPSPAPPSPVAPVMVPQVVAPPPPPPRPAPVFGFDFSPYTQGDGPGFAVPDSRITSLLGVLRGRSTWIKVAGSTGGLANIPRLAHEMGFKVAAAAYINGDPSFDAAEVAQLEKSIKAGYVDLAMVGSEAVWDHFITADALAAEMDTVRGDIRGVSSVPVTTVEPDQSWFDHPQLAQHADVVVANVTPFSFHVPYSQSLAWVQQHYNRLVHATGKTVYIGETEWASEGGSFGGAVANPYNSARYFAAIEHWARPNHVGVFYFEAFDEPWLSQSDSSYGPHWGVFTTSGAIKPGMEDGFLTP